MPALKTKDRKIFISKGNGKIGQMMIWSIPAGDSCPGKSDLCFENCYARKNHFTHKTVINVYRKNWRAAERDNFAELMVAEIKKRPEKLFRIHAAGDFYSAEYVDKWAKIAKMCPDVRFYAYTRSWRLKNILKALLAFRRLPNVRMWFSVDQETGRPPRKYRRVKIAYMQVGADDIPSATCDLVFRDHHLRRSVQKKINGVMVCPVENGVTKLTCEQCKFCFNYEKPEERAAFSLPVLN